MTRPATATILALALAVTGGWLLTSQPPDPAATSTPSPPAAAADSPDTSTLASHGQNPPAPRVDPPTPTAEIDHDHELRATHETTPAGEPWRSTLTTFAAAFTDTTGGQQAWHRRLAPVVSPPVADQLAYTDPARIPTGDPSRITIAATGAYAVHALVDYDTGWSVRVQLVDSGTTDGWWVADYQLAPQDMPP